MVFDVCIFSVTCHLSPVTCQGQLCKDKLLEALTPQLTAVSHLGGKLLHRYIQCCLAISDNF